MRASSVKAQVGQHFRTCDRVGGKYGERWNQRGKLAMCINSLKWKCRVRRKGQRLRHGGKQHWRSVERQRNPQKRRNGYRHEGTEREMVSWAKWEGFQSKEVTECQMQQSSSEGRNCPFYLLVVKNPRASVGDVRDEVGSLGWKAPLEESKATDSSVLAWNPHGQRSLAGCSPQCCKESDMTEAT